MAQMRIADGPSMFDQETDERRERSMSTRRTEDSSGTSTGLVLAGIAVVAIGVWAVYHFGPDFRRYIKMEMM
jgi:hypothetical protein